MDKDKSQLNHLLHHEKNHEEGDVSAGNGAEHDSSDKQEDMDALEAKLFAMAKSRL